MHTMFTVKDSCMYTERNGRERIDELHNLSEMARRVFLHRQCQEIQVDVESMLANKTTFLGDLVKSLSKVTGEWRAWKHEIFGGVRTKVYVASIAQVDELLTWTEDAYSTQSKLLRRRKSSDSYRKFTTETLKSFLGMCATLRNIERKLNETVSSPLKSFFTDASGMKYLPELHMLQNHWRCLLLPGAINSAFFSKASGKYLKSVEGYENFNNFYVVLRLIPDLCHKAHECLEVISRCLDAEDTKAYQREAKFLARVWLPQQRTNMDLNEEEKLKSFLPKLIENDLSKESLAKCKLSEVRQQLEEARILTEKLGEKEFAAENLLKAHIEEKERILKLFESLSTERFDLQGEIGSMRKRVKLGMRNMHLNMLSRFCPVDKTEAKAYLQLKESVANDIKHTESCVKRIQVTDMDVENCLFTIERIENMIFQGNLELAQVREQKFGTKKKIETLEASEHRLISECKALRVQVSVHHRKWQQISSAILPQFTKKSLHELSQGASLPGKSD